MDVMLGLVFWFFGTIGLITAGKAVKRWIAGLIANHPDALRKSFGLDGDGAQRPSRLEEALGSGR